MWPSSFNLVMQCLLRGYRAFRERGFGAEAQVVGRLPLQERCWGQGTCGPHPRGSSESVSETGGRQRCSWPGGAQSSFDAVHLDPASDPTG